MSFKAIAKSKFRRAACLCLTGIMTASLGAGSLLAFADDGASYDKAILDTVNFTDVTGKVNLNGVALQNLAPSVLENVGYKVKNETRTVIVTLDGECILDVKPDDGAVTDYIASYQGNRKLRNINEEQNNFLNSLSSLGIDYKVVYQYSTITNSVAISVNTQYLSKIKSLPNVKSAVVSETYAYPEETVTYTTDSLSDGSTASELGQSNPSNVYETGIYNSSKYTDTYSGEGMTVAILDTGIDYTHTAFQNMPPEETLGMTKADVDNKVKTENLKAVSLSAAKGKTVTVDDLYVNDKIPFAYDYADRDTDVYPAYSQHGVHVAGIVAGDAEEYTDKNGNTATDGQGNKLQFKGAAPNAQLVICKVFTDDFENPAIGGAEAEDIIAALEDCVMLGVDVINMSLGTTAGFSSLFLDGDSEGILLGEIYDKVRDAGISLMCAASNDYSSGFGSAFGTNLASNPDSGTIGSPSTFNGSLSVASINGQLTPFMLANAGTDAQSVVYFSESSDANAVHYDFIKQMLGDDKSSETFKYVVVPNIGQAGDYTSAVKNELANKKEGEKVIAVIKRGSTTFKDKVEIAESMGADAVIVYNNVAGTVGMTLGELEDPIPAVSITLAAGNALVNRYENGKKLLTGTIEINRSYQAGPFMNDYSSWGTTPDLKIKPEVTAHGGEITSTVSGGYDEMSGTSMATPNLAGFAALLRGKLKQEHPDWNNRLLNQRVNQIIMSTAVTVYDQEGLAYSPRKQGSGLATLDNVFSTKAYLYTVEDETHYTIGGVYKEGKSGNFYVEDGRPKFELGDDPAKNGVYNVSFYVSNEFGAQALKFKPQTIFMTETLSPDGFSVAEKAHYLEDIPAEWIVGGKKIDNTDTITVDAGQSVKIQVTLKLSDAEKEYIDKTFINGMYVEGFLKLISENQAEQCDLTLPFMGFYGDWKAAPMLDYSAFEITEFQKDKSYTDETRPQAQVWATQAYASYYNDKYSVPIGGFMYLQNEYADQIYVEEEHSSVSGYNVYYGEEGDAALDNYLSTTEIKALYAGLLRNAEIVTYDLYDDTTGELILSDCVYRVSKAYAGGGSSVPANVKLELKPEELGLVNNGKYKMSFHFYFDSDTVGIDDNEDNIYTMTFYVDYEAPVLVDSRIRYYDYKENNKDKQRVYLDLDIYDNHYAQAVVLCYSDQEYKLNEVVPETKLFLATEYVTPIYNANKNGITTVSIEITDFYEQYQNRLYIQIDDYALNHSVYAIRFSSAKTTPLPDNFEIAENDEITIGKNQTYKISLDYEGSANISNFDWSSRPTSVVKVKDGEIFGVSVGTATVTVRNPVSGTTRTVKVNVVDSDTKLSTPSISFGVIENSDSSIEKAVGTVKVHAGKEFSLKIITDPWYYPYDLNIKWSSSNPAVATVDNYGNVKTLEKKGNARIDATILDSEGRETSYVASVTLSVQDPFTVVNNVLTSYHGLGGENGVLVLPDDMNITNIGEKAFEDNDNVRVIVIPKTVRQIDEQAFLNCVALEEIYFISTERIEPANSSLSIIMKDAFKGCTSLKKVDLSNCKTITVDARAFMNCTKLSEIVDMQKMGTLNEFAFSGCTSLRDVDITGLHVAAYGVFMNCTAIETVKADYYTSLGEAIFKGCTSLKEAVINCPVISEEAFADCVGLKNVTFASPFDGHTKVAEEYFIGANAFKGCTSLEGVEFNGKQIATVGDYSFSGCVKLSQLDTAALGNVGINAFEHTLINYEQDIYSGAIYSGTTLLLAPSQITSDFEIRQGTTEIAPYAFAGSNFGNGVTLIIPDSVKSIGECAFFGSSIKNITLSDGLTQISAFAFAVSQLKGVSIPASVTEIGVSAFARCSDLSSVNFEGTRAGYLTIGMNAFAGCSFASIQLADLAPDENGKVILADFVFANNTSLKDVDLKNVTAIGDYSFYGCTSLESIDLKNVTAIGDGAFNLCKNLKTVMGLSRVTDIGNYAFSGANLSGIDISSAKNIGMQAFYGSNVTKVTIPASLETFGDGAFANSRNLTAYEVLQGNKSFFAENGVLYRIISGTKENGAYELCAYPSAKIASALGNVKTYSIKDGTFSIQAYAFSNLVSGAVGEVKIAYSVKTIGNGAFYNSGITSYVFESINAPVLLTMKNESYTKDYENKYSLLYINFENEFLKYVSADLGGNGETSSLKISYPENGIGYDNYVYSRYFGVRVSLGELIDDTTRSLKEVIEGLQSATEVAGWTKLDKNENLAMVSEFSEQVKNAHAAYNTITSAKQLEYLGAENVQKLFDIENALKDVKSYYGIKVGVNSISLAEDSAHKTEYKVGEKFDMTGLKIIVTYDDYSTEQADITAVKLSAGYDGALTTLDRYVRVEYQGKQLQIRIEVTEDEGKDPPNPDTDTDGNGTDGNGCGSGCAGTTFLGSGGGGFTGLGIVAIAVAAGIIVKRKKNAKEN